jgi:hypothetical protein
VARLLLLGALAVAGVAHAGPVSRAALPRCAASNLRVSVQTQGESTIAWIGVTVRNPGAACALSGSVAFTIEQAGRVAAVNGNPLKISLQERIGRGHTRLVKAGWNNWCRSRRQLVLVVRYAGVTRRMAFKVLPVCLDRRRPSRLLPID